MGRVAELKTLAVIERTMSLLRTILLTSLLGFCATGCRHMTPLVTEDTDRTGWVQVAKVPAVSVVKMQRVMIRAGIPAWFDASGYPYYPVTVPPEHRERAAQILEERGYHVVSK